MNDTVKLGKPKYEASKKNYFAFKKDQNTFILRILPPMGNLAEKGKWSLYHRVEFGYTGTDTRMKPFLSPRVVNYDGMVEVESECHLRREKIKSQLKQAEDMGNTAMVEQCKTMLRKYNQDAKHYMNVVDLQGNVGLFKIGHRGYQSLMAEIDRLRSEGVDPVGIENGRYFIFSRSGKGRDTVYTVTEYKQKQMVEGPGGSKVEADLPFPHSINESIMAKLSTDAFELDKVYPTVTPEEEYRIVHEGAKAVDEIFGKKTEKSNPASTSTQTTATAPAVETAPAPASEAAPVSTAQVGDATVDTNTGEIVNEAPAAGAGVAASAAEGSGVAQMSEEDFFKNIESM